MPGTCRVFAGFPRRVPPPIPGLPSYEEEAAADPEAFTRLFLLFYQNQDPLTAQGLCQRQDTRWLVHNPPMPRSPRRRWTGLRPALCPGLSPPDRQSGPVRALGTIRFSLPTHRGCYGEAIFCAIAVHEGRTVSSRSEASILREARQLTHLPGFKGHILDCGGPTAHVRLRMPQGNAAGAPAATAAA
jgi:radical SAM superfamily enzyme YgiQ (UPF0313 family)